MSLRWRLAVILAGVAAGSAVIVSVLAFWMTRDQLNDNIDDFLLMRAGEFTVGQEGGGRGRPDHRDGPPALELVADPDAETQFLSPDGRVVFDRGGSDVPVEPIDIEVATARGSAAVLRDVTVNGESHRMITAPLPDGGAVQVARSLVETETALDALVRRTIVLGAVAVVVAAAVGWLVARWVTRPIERLTEAAEEVASTSDLVEPIPVERSDEVGRLATSFNAMLAALDRSRQQQRRLVMDASHELRTPLTTLRTNIELLQRAENAGDGAIDREERRRIVDDTVVELAELSTLVSELVDLAAEPDHGEQPLEQVSLRAIADEVVARFERRTDLDLRVEGESEANVAGGRQALERAVSNLVDNACKFTPSGGSVTVVVTATGVAVRDTGPGIPPDERARVFDRFWRSDAARSTSGSGLGLSIVEQIARDHGGDVFVGSTATGGAEVGFRLPDAIPAP